MTWISVKDRMPDIETCCLIYSKRDGIFIGYLRDLTESAFTSNEWNRTIEPQYKRGRAPTHEWFIMSSCWYGMPFEVTHWMPLPEKPQQI